MISKKRFMQLKRGDVVLFGAHNTPRIVEIGPANYDPPIEIIEFSKLKSSWTGRAPTTYGIYSRHLMSLPRGTHDKKKLREIANQRLSDMGINPKKALIAEATELKRMQDLHRKWGVGSKFICSTGHSWPKEDE